MLFANTGHKALGINDDNGKTVGITTQANGAADEGYYWNRGSSSNFTSILGADYFPVAGINNQNLSAGWDGIQASTFQIGDLDHETLGKLLPTDDFSIAYGLNDLNQIVGMSGSKGFIYESTSQSLLNANQLNLSGVTSDNIKLINDINNNSSTFIGIATINGVEHGFLATLAVPEPSSLVLTAASLFMFARFRTRKNRH